MPPWHHNDLWPNTFHCCAVGPLPIPIVQVTSCKSRDLSKVKSEKEGGTCRRIRTSHWKEINFVWLCHQTRKVPLCQWVCDAKVQGIDAVLWRFYTVVSTWHRTSFGKSNHGSWQVCWNRWLTPISSLHGVHWFPTFSGVHRRIFGSRNSECNILFHQFGMDVIGKHSPRLATRGHVGTCQTRTSGEGDTVDGKNPAPVDMADIPLFAGFHTCQVVQDFFRQQ